MLTTLVLTAAAMVVPASSASASYRLYCNPDGDSRQIVVLVHGFNSSPGTWDDTSDEILTGGGDDSCVVKFDYADWSTNWVTNSHIGPELATFIETWSSTSSAGGGTGKVVIVAHSMGGLAARCALDVQCSDGHDVADKVAHITTLGTPNTGSSLRGSDLTPTANQVAKGLSALCRLPNLAAVAANLVGICQLIEDLGTSEATKAFTPDSPELRALPHLPDNFPLYAMAGQVNLRTSLFGHVVDNVGSIGDLVVGVTSAHDEATTVTTGTDADTATIACGNLDIPSTASLLLLGGTFAAADIWIDINCHHVNETTSDLFLYPARHRIQDTIDATAPTIVFGPGARINGALLTETDAVALLTNTIGSDFEQFEEYCQGPITFYSWRSQGVLLEAYAEEPYVSSWTLSEPSEPALADLVTADGVRVGDSESKLVSLYPDIPPGKGFFDYSPIDGRSYFPDGYYYFVTVDGLVESAAGGGLCTWG
ncbi:hypothetical protein QQX13_02430 [Demequina sp. SYSU T00068]|uniref:esterase/lipase family protein n=1 Tax=Demequina lignilytica TaxID=3051663 RepID=UPI00261BE052|nr:alpha/beta fold hydrolase [Demequina sp. SYSU T00068]MDN4489681.1 hypothetical protein [Demequina sp. SYSU T00068]